MNAALDDAAKLRRVLAAELRAGCRDSVVIGGLDEFLRTARVADVLPAEHPVHTLLRALPAGGYRSLGGERRRAWLRAALAALDGHPTSADTVSPVRRTGLRSPAQPQPRPSPSSRAWAGSSGPRVLRPDAPLSALPGVSRALAAKFERLGVRTLGDAAFHFPRRFADFTEVRAIRALGPTAHPVTVVAKVASVSEARFGPRLRGAEAILVDGTGALRVVWFNMPYVAKHLAVGEEVVVSGKVRLFRGRLQMENPEYEPFDAETMSPGRLIPVYPATQGLGQKTVRRVVRAAVEAVADQLADPLPHWVAERDGLVPLAQAVRAYHAPASFGEAEEARRRIALGELLAVQVAVLRRRMEWQQAREAPRLRLGKKLEAFLASLPFTLTASQRRALDDILDDIARPEPMLRLLQGDVGSGKTVVALAAMLAAVHSGYQAALMAPTEILAEQHYRTVAHLLGGDEPSPLAGVYVPPWLGRPVRVLLLTGSLGEAEKEQVRRDVAHGGADIVVGTHALIEDDVAIPRLGLAIVDEQHRFGVMQRVKLRRKGTNPHLLVMTATPIPRTLALTVYGDLEVSTIDELPAGRKPVKTVWVQPHERAEAYAFVRERLDAGEQAYVICPLVEESETLDVRSAEEEYERLRTGPFRAYRVELLHGRMPAKQKEEVMRRFARGEAQVLVSTSVIEVGIDVPNATVILIEGAERFGLSQLHQFRGRVGRSERQSYCLLFSTDEDPGPEARERLQAMVETTDGFRLAEVDLEMRGEGEVWGRAQSGPNSMLRVARFSDRDLLGEARRLAMEILEVDPELRRPEHRVLADAARPFLERATEAN